MPQWEVVGGSDKGGILVRTGKDLSSPAEYTRLATGSIVEQLELHGERLNYRVVTGEGPKTGWVSISLKGKPLLIAQAAEEEEDAAASDEPSAAELSETTPVEERPYDIVVYGATGFTGMLIVQHLDALIAEKKCRPHKWAIAGRDARKLRGIQEKCKSGPAVLTATTPEEVTALANRCRVVVSAAGPHGITGEPVIRGCVAHGTHYTDVTGETSWVKSMIAKYDEEAKAKGVMIVCMCAMQASPADVLTMKLVQHLGPLKQARGYVVQVGYTSGGTDATGRYSMEVMSKNPEAFDDFVDPFGMGGLRGRGVQECDRECSVAVQDTLYPKIWLGALGCGASDARCVRRSSELFETRGDKGLRYGEDFSIQFREPCGTKPAADRTIQQAGSLPSAAIAPFALQMMTDGLKSGQSPPPGQGPPPEARELFHSTYILVAEGEDGAFATATYTGGENYEVTAMCAVTGAVVLLEEPEKLDLEECGGIVTPAFAFLNSTFVERLEGTPFGCLRKGASMKFEIADGKAEETDIKKVMTARSRDFAVVTEKFTGGKLKQWAVPALK